jgi:putative hemolysin
VTESEYGYESAKNFARAHAEPICIAIITGLLLIFGEVGPKRVALLWPTRLAVLYAPLLDGCMRLFTPFRVILQHITTALQGIFTPTKRSLSGEEFESIVDLSGEEGILDQDEHQMVRGIIRLEDLQASDVMTPRVDIIGIDLNDPRPEAYEQAVKSKLRRIVLYRDQLDDVDGFLDVHKYALDPDHQIKPAWLSPMYVPETAPLDKLLAQFQREHRRAAIVVDEYGGTAGIITRGDVLEEIVGEIGDDVPEQGLVIESMGPHRWLLDGSVNLEELKEKLGVKLKGEGVDRLAGWVMQEAERMPRPGDVVQADGCKATIQRIRKHRIELVLLEKLTDDEEDDL